MDEKALISCLGALAEAVNNTNRAVLRCEPSAEAGEALQTSVDALKRFNVVYAKLGKSTVTEQ